VQLRDESSFDPRAVARYHLGFDPDGAGAASHFLDDPILAHFEVDHVEQLLEAYGRELVLEPRRTDPPAGSVAGGARLPDIPVTVSRRALDARRLDAVDRRVAEALAANPDGCLSAEVNTGGVTLEAAAPLEPAAEYDLLLSAPRIGDRADASCLVARGHFRTSRFADVPEMLAALGFDSAGRAPLIPYDFVVSDGALFPAADAAASDESLEAALRALGMDPWPVVGFGRTVAIWRPGATADQYLLAGLLLELPEPIERGQRCGVVRAKAGRKVFTPIRRNGAGTRVLLAAPAPEGVALGGTNLTLELELRDGATTLTGTRYMRARPRIAYQEAL
jgi:hypothetical protein